MKDSLSRGRFKKRKFLVLMIIFLSLSLFSGKKTQAKDEGVKNSLSIPDIAKIMTKCEVFSTWCNEWQKKDENNSQEILYKNLLEGYPMEKMAPYLAKQDVKTAGFLVAIAKKESNWGKHSPQKSGQTCHNYWGYKGSYNQTPSGYSCFDSAEQAVEVVGKRIADLLDKGIDTPEKMLVWKCGSSCQGHDPKGVVKWVSDVKSVLISLNN